MNIDERLDRLTERHDALIRFLKQQSLNIEALGHRMDASTKSLDPQVANVEGSTQKVDTTMDAIDKLLQLATSRERRIDHRKTKPTLP